MGEIKEQKTLEEEPTHLPSPFLSKRKPEVDTATEDLDPSKKLKKSDLEIPIAAQQENHNSTADGPQEDRGSNGNPRIDKGKAVMRDDKGKGKAKVEEEEEDSSGGSSDDDGNDGVENNGGDDEDSDVSDDPLAEVDLDNILPSRTRRREAEPGAYLVNDMDDDDDDDDDEVEEDAEDEDSE